MDPVDPTQHPDAPPPSGQPLPPEFLRWRCDPRAFDFETTDDVEPMRTVVGQDAAIDALRFGLECMAPGQNVFVRGLTGTGRMTLVRRMLDEISPACPLAPDRAYVHDFDDPRRPRLLTLPRGTGVAFGKAMEGFVDYVREDVPKALGAEAFLARLRGLQESSEASVREQLAPVEQELKDAGLALVTVTGGHAPRPAVFARIEGEPVPPEVYATRHARGDVPDEEYERTMAAIQGERSRMDELAAHIARVMEEHFASRTKLIEDELHAVTRPAIDRVLRSFDEPEIRAFLDAVLADLVSSQELLAGPDADLSFLDRYLVNVVSARDTSTSCPCVVEGTPTAERLVGAVEPPTEETAHAPHLLIRGGSILAADGGYLILEARDLLTEPEAWRSLVRVLRTGELEITPAPGPWLVPAAAIKPQPIPVTLKVVLLGDPDVFYVLDSVDPDFPHLFKVLADFDTSIPRTHETLAQYAAVIRRIADDDRLPAFSRDAVAALAEHGVRIAGNRGRLSTRFSRLADIAREAGFIARKSDERVVSGDHVRETVVRTKRRGSLSSRRFREMVSSGAIRIETTGRLVGQANGLAVIHAGAVTYGFPARITATIGAGTGGVINIEREAALSGAIHTKGFYILGGLLRYLLRTEHPLAFEASIAFEQSYGGIDGDSASGVEICCLVSALTHLPMRQDLAMTGAIDQVGNVLAIGGLNEKIEGFYDVCLDAGLTGTQGVLIPASNVADLMLRHDVVEACGQGRFHVIPVATIAEALELFMERQSGWGGENGAVPPPESVLGRARERALAFWRMSAMSEHRRHPSDSR